MGKVDQEGLGIRYLGEGAERIMMHMEFPSMPAIIALSSNLGKNLSWAVVKELKPSY